MLRNQTLPLSFFACPLIYGTLFDGTEIHLARAVSKGKFQSVCQH